MTHPRPSSTETRSSKTAPAGTPSPERQVRDQDGRPQGTNGRSGDPRTQSRGQSAHAYGKEDVNRRPDREDTSKN